MEREGLKRDFGDRLVFHGGVDNQYTLPFGTVADVRQEVRDNLRILGEGGGYILAPCHNIQPVSPPENIVGDVRDRLRARADCKPSVEAPVLNGPRTGRVGP